MRTSIALLIQLTTDPRPEYPRSIHCKETEPSLRLELLLKLAQQQDSGIYDTALINQELNAEIKLLTILTKRLINLNNIWQSFSPECEIFQENRKILIDIRKQLSIRSTETNNDYLTRMDSHMNGFIQQLNWMINDFGRYDYPQTVDMELENRESNTAGNPGRNRFSTFVPFVDVNSGLNPIVIAELPGTSCIAGLPAPSC